MSSPAVYQPALMVEGGWGDFSFHYSNAWAAADVGTQKVTAEHVTEKREEREIYTDASPLQLDFSGLSHLSYVKTHLLTFYKTITLI